MADSPVIIAHLRWISLIFGLFALYMSTTLSSDLKQNTPELKTPTVQALSEVLIDAPDIYAETLAGEVPAGVEFASLDMMLAGRSNLDPTAYRPINAAKSSNSSDNKSAPQLPKPPGPGDLTIELRY